VSEQTSTAPSFDLSGILDSDPRRPEAEALLEQWRELLPGYELEELIGIGGTSCVFQGTQQSLGRRVAVKVLFPTGSGAPDVAGMLKREGRGIASLTHPNIIRVIDFGVLETRPYLVLEFVDAPSLACVLKDGPLAPVDALKIAVQCAAALEHAHEKGVCHRDLKPSNILLDEQGHAWLLDFGIASISQAQLMTSMTQKTLPHAGSMSYMPPERLKSHGEASPAEDIYSLGVVLYEMLMGFPPHGAYPPIRVAEKAMPQLDQIVARAIAHDPANRWASAREFRLALEEALHLHSSGRSAKGVRTEDSATRSLWWLIAAGGVLFISECFIIGLSKEDRFSLPAGPGSKLFDSALAIIACNTMLLAVWTWMLVQFWRQSRKSATEPPPSTVVMSYLAIVFCITCVVFLAVKD